MRAPALVLILLSICPLAASAEEGSTECVLFKKFPKDSIGDFYRRDSLPVHGTLPGDLPRRDPPSSSNFKIFGKDLSGSSDFRIYGGDLLPRNWRFSNPVLRRYPDGLAPGRHYSFDNFKIFGKELSGSSDFWIYGDDLLPQNWRFSNPVLRRYPAIRPDRP